jgi:hypothetical protein
LKVRCRRFVALYRLPHAAWLDVTEQRRLCTWGVALKVLIPRAAPRACVLKGQEAPEGARKWQEILTRIRQVAG